MNVCCRLEMYLIKCLTLSVHVSRCFPTLPQSQMHFESNIYFSCCSCISFFVLLLCTLLVHHLTSAKVTGVKKCNRTMWSPCFAYAFHSDLIHKWGLYNRLSQMFGTILSPCFLCRQHCISSLYLHVRNCFQKISALDERHHAAFRFWSQ